MRMKFNKLSQLGLVAAAGLAAATLVTACSQLDETLTVDFVFVASSRAAGPNNYGQIDVFEINSESGKMRHIPASPFPSGGRDPVSEAVSADNGSLFVANQDDDNIVQFVIGTDGKLYALNTVNTPGIFPVAIAANKANLFVVDTYQPLPICSTADPCSGSITAFPLTAATSSTPVAMQANLPINSCNGPEYLPLTLSGAAANDIVAPTGINILPNGSAVFVSAYDTTANAGYVYGFTIGSTMCTINSQTVTITTLTPVAGSPFAAGVHPSGIASDSTSSYVYVTDFSSADVLGYSVCSSSSPAPGALIALGGGSASCGNPVTPTTFPAGNQPSAIVVDPAYPYAYVVNSLDSTIEAYSITNGALTFLGGSSTPVVYITGTQPVALGIDPSTERFIFVANFLSDTVSGFELSPSAGTLVESQFSPFASDDWPTAVAAIPHNGTGGGIEPQ
jgi:6-phosphogluconolactonase